MQRSFSKCLGVAAMLGFAAGVIAAPFSVTYTDSIKPDSSEPLPAGIKVGEQVVAKLILDNGNSAQDKYVAIDYSSTPFTFHNTGNFVTNASGQLQPAVLNWVSFPIPNPFTSNISGVTTLYDWVFQGGNSGTAWFSGTTTQSRWDLQMW